MKSLPQTDAERRQTQTHRHGERCLVMRSGRRRELASMALLATNSCRCNSKPHALLLLFFFVLVLFVCFGFSLSLSLSLSLSHFIFEEKLSRAYIRHECATGSWKESTQLRILVPSSSTCFCFWFCGGLLLLLFLMALHCQGFFPQLLQMISQNFPNEFWERKTVLQRS